jgi:hypothetical protein
MGKTVVLIDSGFLKYSTRFAARARLNIANDEPLTKLANHPGAMGAIYDTLATSLRSKLGHFEEHIATIDRCIVCLDIGDSWRTSIKKTLIPGTEQASSIDYKGHRRTTDAEELEAIVKLNGIYKKCIEFLCTNSGIELVGAHGIESDDFMVILSQQYAKQGNLVFVMSKDADITQAVCSTEAKGATIIMQPCHNGEMHFVVDHETYNRSACTSIFSMSEFPTQIANIITNAQIVAPQLSCNHVIMGKCIL